jgi:hypothetical protein
MTSTHHRQPLGFARSPDIIRREHCRQDGLTPVLDRELIAGATGRERVEAFEHLAILHQAGQVTRE